MPMWVSDVLALVGALCLLTSFGIVVACMWAVRHDPPLSEQDAARNARPLSSAFETRVTR